MSDQSPTTAPQDDRDERVEEQSSDERVVTGPPASAPVDNDQIVAQEAKVLGDEEIADASEFSPSAEVNTEAVPRQVTQDREPDPDTVPVSETSVTVDRVITDTSDPLAVQVPDAGKGDASTPIARAYSEARHVEDVFRAEASDPDDS